MTSSNGWLAPSPLPLPRLAVMNSSGNAPLATPRGASLEGGAEAEAPPPPSMRALAARVSARLVSNIVARAASSSRSTLPGNRVPNSLSTGLEISGRAIASRP